MQCCRQPYRHKSGDTSQIRAFVVFQVEYSKLERLQVIDIRQPGLLHGSNWHVGPDGFDYLGIRYGINESYLLYHICTFNGQFFSLPPIPYLRMKK